MVEFSKNARVILEKRYLRDGETPETMLARVAHAVASAEKPESREFFRKAFFELMGSLDFLPNSPTLMNAGVPDGTGQLSACFVLPLVDSMEGIFGALHAAALVMKSGGGVGFDFSPLRPSGDSVRSTNGVASGPISFLGLFDKSIDVVKQGGTRRGAAMGILSADHPDIIDFIRAKTQDGILSNFNISVALSDAFFHALEKNEDWNLVSSRTGVVERVIKAKELFDLIVHAAHASGDPGIIFPDRINQDNPTPHLGKISATNPCVIGDTSIMTPRGRFHANKLTGRKIELLVDGKVYESDERGFFITGRKQVFRLVTNVPGVELFATEDHPIMAANPQRDGSFSWMPMGKLLPRMKVRMHNHTSYSEWDRIMADMARRGDEFGVLTRDHMFLHNFELTVVNILPFFNTMSEDGLFEVYDVCVPGINAFDGDGFYLHNCGEQPLLPYEACNLGSVNLKNMVKTDKSVDWNRLEKTVRLAVRFLDNVISINTYPLPEIQRMSEGNRKIGLGVMGWAEMLFLRGIAYDSEDALFAAEKVMSFIQHVAHEESVALAMERGGYPNCQTTPVRRNATVTTIAPTGTISLLADCSSGIEPVFALSHERKALDGKETLKYRNAVLQDVLDAMGLDDESKLSDDIKRVFVCAHDISWEWHVRMQAVFQKHLENACSKTINMPHDATLDDVRNAYLMAWRSGCKGITIYRDGCKASQVLYAATEKRKEVAEQTAEAAQGPAERPTVLSGKTVKMPTSYGNLYLTINELDGYPFEVFATLGKSGKDTQAHTEALGRLTSLALRSGISVQEVVSQLRGIGGSQPVWGEEGVILSLPDAIGQCLERAMGGIASGVSVIDMCPSCGMTLAREEGCIKCVSCGYSRC